MPTHGVGPRCQDLRAGLTVLTAEPELPHSAAFLGTPWRWGASVSLTAVERRVQRHVQVPGDFGWTGQGIALYSLFPTECLKSESECSAVRHPPFHFTQRAHEPRRGVLCPFTSAGPGAFKWCVCVGECVSQQRWTRVPRCTQLSSPGISAGGWLLFLLPCFRRKK